MLSQLSRNKDTAKSFIRRPGVTFEDETAISVPTSQPPPLHRPTLIRRTTLSRPERGHQLAPLLNPDGEPDDPFSEHRSPPWYRLWWHYLAIICTFWAPPPILSLFGMNSTEVRQAWREKVTLVLFAMSLSAIIAFITVGLQRSLCPDDIKDVFVNVKQARSVVGIQGTAYDTENAKFPQPDIYPALQAQPGLDLTPLLDGSNFPYDRCARLSGRFAQWQGCVDVNNKPARCIAPLSNRTADRLGLAPKNKDIGYDWEDVMKSRDKLLTIDGYVLNMDSYMAYNPRPISGDVVDSIIRQHFGQAHDNGPDATRLFTDTKESMDAIPCLKQRYMAGRVNYKTAGCFVAELILYVSLTVILGLVLARTIMAIWYAWVGSVRMASTPPLPGHMSAVGSKRPRPISHLIMPADAAASNSAGVAPWADKRVRSSRIMAPEKLPRDLSTNLPSSMTADDIGNDPYIVCLVTCYSEGMDGISATLSSLSATEYPANRKLIFVVADGMVTGEGETASTPDICVSLLSPDPRFGTPTPMSYRSVAAGRRAHNKALVYAGHYLHPSGGEPVPMIVVAKCGLPEDAGQAKPGNRGKRDSQMILLNFLQRVTYNDRMSPLDYDLFRKSHALMGVTPDFFELCLMVDADTKVHPPALRCLCNAMLNDHRTMGACGETRIENKAQSWVTAIQVFEYFISHHQVKAFEAVFGGVTCLPGCFSMYRIKARKPGFQDWIPVLVKPEITREYSQSTVKTLHQKNLLLLGEDRFLSTLMLRTFPHRRMVFVSQAVCHTEVPARFLTLLSQRRRWINSTVHNLMELMLVRDLCGTFCFSMQFVVLMDLIGTLVLPVAISLTYYLIVSSIITPPHDFTSAIPLVMLIAVLFLPGLVITAIHFRLQMVFWLIIYLIFLPVWNFILPVYSFWHFDDFTWGATRKIEGDNGKAHDVDEEGYQASLRVPMRLWSDWERSRIRKQVRDARRREEMTQQFGGSFHNDQVAPQANDHARLRPLPSGKSLALESSVSGEEDRWGDQIGAYDENEPVPDLMQAARPVSTLMPANLVGEGDMEHMLQDGWDDDDDDKVLRPNVRGPFISVPNHSNVSLSDMDNPLEHTRTSVDMGTLLPHDTAPVRILGDALPATSSAIGDGHTSHARNRSFGHRIERPYDSH
ncbi:chitin synthase [Malassezia nana]|uniref:chitin synthase n=1 Tax=Malassezia nana TaxID=180528 RepID=A0AAF0J2P3_9BASI|nr:chitin synthase [Malassezia nana]